MSAFTNTIIKFSEILKDYSSKLMAFILDHTMQLPKVLNEQDKEFIKKVLKERQDFKAKSGQHVFITMPDSSKLRFILLVGIGDKINEASLRECGGAIAASVNSIKFDHVDVYSDEINSTNTNLAAVYIAFGIQLRNYSFNKYYHAKLEEHSLSMKSATLYLKDHSVAEKSFNRYKAIADGVLLARNLANEPGNVLFPESFAKICEELSIPGLKVKTLLPKELRNLGMNAMLGVAQGSVNEPRLVVLEWCGDKQKKESPICLVGKGVTFDSGGLNLKGGSHMQDMKYDMSGAAAVVGTLVALAKRNAKTNVVGVLGLVENMPSDKAQRPDDVVVSMSGQTIEVNNTDAEGRLVLADALWYTQTNYNPHVLIDLATLTGAIVVALGDGYAGIFSNDDTLAEQLFKSGKESGDLVWRLPIGEHYDNQINSEIADVKNTGQANRGGGSITAAQFLYRFVQDKDNCKWSHIDIAGVATNKFNNHNNKGATGFGVKLLEALMYNYYESK